MARFIEYFEETVAKRESVCSCCAVGICRGEEVVKYYASTCQKGVTYHPSCWYEGTEDVLNISEVTDRISATSKMFRIEVRFCNILQKNHILRMFAVDSRRCGFLGDKIYTDWYTNRNSASKLVKYAEAERLKVKVILSSGEEIITDNFTAYKKFTDNF